MFYADMHCDTITNLADNGGSLLQNDLQVDLHKLMHFDAPLQFFAIWLNPKYYDEAGEKLQSYLAFCLEEFRKHADLISLVKAKGDIAENRKKGKISGLISIEGAEGLAGQPEIIDDLYNKGVREVSLTWNNDTVFACGCNTKNDTGLTEGGRKLIARMDELGIILDVSHCSDKTFWDIAGSRKTPFIASHSNARAVRKHQRNLDDAQLRTLADHGGIAGINLFSDFLSEKERGEISDILEHIDHIINVAGEEHVGFGCDFEGMVVTPIGIESVADMTKVGEALTRKYGSRTAAKIMGENAAALVESML